ncbi:MAG: glycosyltransferase family 2 protein [Weeksellaceae bacterium]|nr:glycosyltransferase family 2 protein [Weeksellaceae bacterium]
MYNAEASIEKCLDSVKAQTYGGDFEILITNDGSTDQSAEVVTRYIAENPDLNITIIHQRNQGVSKARNEGLKISTGEFIALLDADDVWMPEKTERQMAFLQNPDYEIDFLSCRSIKQRIFFPYIAKSDNLSLITFRKLMLRNGVQSPTVLFKRKVLDNTGFFDARQRYAEDLNYWLKVSLNNKMYILGEELVVAGDGKRSFGVCGLSADLKRMEIGFQKNLREMLSLKRISAVEYVLYLVFYKSKYGIRLMRNAFLRMLGR